MFKVQFYTCVNVCNTTRTYIAFIRNTNITQIKVNNIYTFLWKLLLQNNTVNIFLFPHSIDLKALQETSFRNVDGKEAISHIENFTHFSQLFHCLLYIFHNLKVSQVNNS